MRTFERVLTLPRDEIPLGEGDASRLLLDATGQELTLHTPYSRHGVLLKRVFDGRCPLDDEERARAKRIEQVQKQAVAPGSEVRADYAERAGHRLGLFRCCAHEEGTRGGRRVPSSE